ncbi:hypothetical protein FACS1894156_9280 [Bacteroidia bacterium]|nr:hypothetical protein FACS1894156_9280 [Bacteroidia bacterium]
MTSNFVEDVQQPDWKDYNTTRKQLAMPEYGRHIQRMVLNLMTIDDREKRNQQAHAVIAIMGNLFPYLRNLDDFKHKLWDHLFIISDFKLDIDAPYPKPSPAEFEEKPLSVPYSNPNAIKYKHYGRCTQDVVAYVASRPDDDTRRNLVRAVGNHMKRAYLLWNKDVVSDDIIFKDIETLSGGVLKKEEGMSLSVGNYNPNNSQKGGGAPARRNDKQQRSKDRKRMSVH